MRKMEKVEHVRLSPAVVVGWWVALRKVGDTLARERLLSWLRESRLKVLVEEAPRYMTNEEFCAQGGLEKLNELKGRDLAESGAVEELLAYFEGLFESTEGRAEGWAAYWANCGWFSSAEGLYLGEPWETVFGTCKWGARIEGMGCKSFVPKMHCSGVLETLKRELPEDLRVREQLDRSWVGVEVEQEWVVGGGDAGCWIQAKVCGGVGEYGTSPVEAVEVFVSLAEFESGWRRVRSVLESGVSDVLKTRMAGLSWLHAVDAELCLQGWRVFGVERSADTGNLLMSPVGGCVWGQRGLPAWYAVGLSRENYAFGFYTKEKWEGQLDVVYWGPEHIDWSLYEDLGAFFKETAHALKEGCAAEVQRRLVC